MTVNVNAVTDLVTLINATFRESGLTPANTITHIGAFKGTMPADPSVTTGVTMLHASTVSVAGKFQVPSDGVSLLASSISFTPNSSGTLSFVRLYRNTTPVADISCGLSGSAESAIASTLTIVSGTPFSIIDLRSRIACTGNVSVSPSVANHFLGYFLGSSTPSYGGVLSAFSKYNPATTLYDRTVTIDIYDGAIPSRADQTATGTKLWTKSLSNNNLFATTSTLGLTLDSAQTANAIASGVPTYCRVTKAGYTSSGFTFPTTVLQVPVSNASSGCVVSSGTFTSGQSYTITNLTLTLEP